MNSYESDTLIEKATPSDVPIVVEFVKKLADHEGRPETATLTAESLSPILFGERSLADAYLMRHEGEICGFALVSERFSSFRTRRFLYIEDMLISASMQGKGLGRVLLSFLAKTSLEMGGCGLEWSALETNDIALGFYKTIGAEIENGVVHYELKDDALNKFLTDSSDE